jgi:ADP-ribose pyrophosphatase
MRRTTYQAENRDLDDDEFLNVEIHSLDELVSMVYEQKIEDSKTICAIMAYAYRHT